MEAVITSIATVIAAVMASSGFWLYLKGRDQKKDAITQLVLGLAHDRIVHLGMSYINRGWVSKDEYEDFMKYLYSPYSHFGGNGLATRIAAQVTELPFTAPHPSSPRGRRETIR